MFYSTPHELHKKLINHYVLKKRGATVPHRRESWRDIDVIRENHKFVWDEEDVADTWEQRLAKKYYDKLFKEYCISDLSRYKENKFAMRWQTEAEMIAGKGQFICGAKHCKESDSLKTWEVNFAYIEHGEKRNSLVKLRLCLKCSGKLNYHKKRKEVKRVKKVKSKVGVPDPSSRSLAGCVSDIKRDEPAETPTDGGQLASTSQSSSADEDLWKQPLEEPQQISREEEFEKYLEELLL